LKTEHMTSRESTEREVVVESVRELETPATKEQNNGSTTEPDESDLEKGFPNEEEQPEQSAGANLEVMECSSQYTHILVPLAGHSSGEQEVKPETPALEPVKTTWHPSFSKLKSPQDKPSSDSEEDAAATNSTSNIIERAVPIFCAVCLMEYEVSERVCWSSNRECTHVFHEGEFAWFVVSECVEYFECCMTAWAYC
jgi:hypothetical protein